MNRNKYFFELTLKLESTSRNQSQDLGEKFINISDNCCILLESGNNSTFSLVDNLATLTELSV